MEFVNKKLHGIRSFQLLLKNSLKKFDHVDYKSKFLSNEIITSFLIFFFKVCFQVDLFQIQYRFKIKK